jgi:hypothetical protein
MGDSNIEIILENQGGSYKLHQVNSETGKEVSYHGRLYYLLNNENRNFAIVYEKQLPALDGTQGILQIPLEVGVGRAELSFPDLRKKLEDFTHKTARLEADALAKKSGLTVRER